MSYCCPYCKTLLDREPLILGVKYARQIIQLCAEAFDIPEALVFTTQRSFKMVAARHTSMYFIHRYCDISNNGVAKLMGRDHCTVVHARKRCENALKYGMDLCDQINFLEEQIEKIIHPLKKAS